MYGTTLRLTKSPEQAKDLAQDIFVRLWESREKLKEVQNPQSYIYILSRNLVMDFLRKKVFDTSNVDYLISYFKSDAAGPQEKAELKELQDLLNEAVEALPERQKQVFRLSRDEGLTHEQIAGRLGISAVSSKTYIVRALQQIRDFVASRSDERILAMMVLLFFLQ